MGVTNGKLLSRSRLYALIERYRNAPVTSSLASAPPGPKLGSRRLQVIQIDHTRVDLFMVDAVHRRPIQRPWLTLAIDVASRMKAGFYLSLEAPSVSVALAIHHAVTPKAHWLATHGTDFERPVAVLPDFVHVDNSREFRARALERGATEHGIELIHRPVATPHYGGHIGLRYWGSSWNLPENLR